MYLFILHNATTAVLFPIYIILTDGKTDTQRLGHIPHFFFGKFANIVSYVAFVQGPQLFQHDHGRIFHSTDHTNVTVYRQLGFCMYAAGNWCNNNRSREMISNIVLKD